MNPTCVGNARQWSVERPAGQRTDGQILRRTETVYAETACVSEGRLTFKDGSMVTREYAIGQWHCYYRYMGQYYAGF